MSMRRRSHRPTPYFCESCLHVYDAAQPEGQCPACHLTLQPVVDAYGALTREYLLARKKCCENLCRNCPWGHPSLLASIGQSAH